MPGQKGLYSVLSGKDRRSEGVSSASWRGEGRGWGGGGGGCQTEIEDVDATCYISW